MHVLLAWWYGLVLGAERFEHFTRYRRDPLLSRLLGLPRFPSPDTLRRFFSGFTYRQTTEVSEALMRVSLSAMRPILLGHTLDLDSTIFCRYGDQAGSLKEHNPVKRGRPSHQSFDATDAAFRTGCVLFNLLMGFRETVLPSCWFERRLRAVRNLVFLVGADLIPAARRLRVRFAVPPEERAEFLHRLRTLSAGLPLRRSWTGSSARPTTLCCHRDGGTPPYGLSKSRRMPRAPPPNPVSTAESGIITPVAKAIKHNASFRRHPVMWVEK